MSTKNFKSSYKNTKWNSHNTTTDGSKEEKKPYKNPNTEFFKLSALTNLLNAGILILILIVMCYMLYAQTAEQAYLREVSETLIKSITLVP